MNRPDRHNEIEINFFLNGGITFLIKDRIIKVKSNQFLIFWALMPHQIINVDDNSPYYVFTIPFKEFVEWDLPFVFKDFLLAGEVLLIDNKTNFESELFFYERWINDFETNNHDAVKCAIYELHSKLFRIAIDVSLQKKTISYVAVREGINLVERIAIFITKNYTNGVTVNEVGQALGIHPDYANSIFKKTFKVTIKDFINDQRISHAQRLLSTTSKKIIEIAFESGFKTLSRFNVSFSKKCNCTPREYRRMYNIM